MCYTVVPFLFADFQDILSICYECVCVLNVNIYINILTIENALRQASVKYSWQILTESVTSIFLRKKGEDEIYVHELSITNSKILRLTSALYCFQRVKVNFFMNLRMEII